jgi:thioredoxin 1
MALEHVNDANFSEKTATGVVLVDFWASWCGPCQMFGPIFEAAAAKTDGVSFLKFEIDEANRRIPAQHGIRSIPSVLAFRDGELIEVRTGLMDIETLQAWIKEIKGS